MLMTQLRAWVALNKTIFNNFRFIHKFRPSHILPEETIHQFLGLFSSTESGHDEFTVTGSKACWFRKSVKQLKNNFFSVSL